MRVHILFGDRSLWFALGALQETISGHNELIRPELGDIALA